MKKVRRISLGKIAFTVEEDACEVLESYVASLQDHFAGNASAQEIMEEVEARMAELLLEKCGEGSVVGMAAVEEAIAVLGTPGQMDEEQGVAGNAGNTGTGRRKPRRELFRDVDNKVIGGVCSGLGAFFGIQAPVIRISLLAVALVPSFFGEFAPLGILMVCYFCMMMAVPVASTVEKRCRMKGESGTVDGIRNTVESAVSEIGDSARTLAKENRGVWKSVLRVMSVLFGAIFAIVGTACLIAVISVLVGLHISLPGVLDTMLVSALGRGISVVAKVAVLLVVLLVAIGFLWKGVSMVFNVRIPHFGLVCTVLWIVSFCTLVGIGACAGMRLAGEEELTEEIVENLSANVLYIDLGAADADYDHIYAEGRRTDYRLGYDKKGLITLYPRVFIAQMSAHESMWTRSRGAVENDSRVFVKLDRHVLAGCDASERSCRMSGDTLHVEPFAISKDVPLQELRRDLTIWLPEDVEARVVGSPCPYDFSEHMLRSNVFWLK